MPGRPGKHLCIAMCGNLGMSLSMLVAPIMPLTMLCISQQHLVYSVLGRYLHSHTWTLRFDGAFQPLNDLSMRLIAVIMKSHLHISDTCSWKMGTLETC